VLVLLAVTGSTMAWMGYSWLVVPNPVAAREFVLEGHGRVAAGHRPPGLRVEGERQLVAVGLQEGRPSATSWRRSRW
jgi:hypothetical protein